MEGTTLLFRHLPAELSQNERTDFLHHFGANRIRVFGKKGKMANTAFASFLTKEHATEVLNQLHQVEMLGSTLIVEFARDTSKAPSIIDDGGKPHSSEDSLKAKKDSGKAESDLKSEPIKFDTTFNTWGLEHPRPPQLKYQYPPPTAIVLTNIMNALASVPAFYVQVLHLMNKMDLPCPFGPLTAAPPLQRDTYGLAQAQADDVGPTEMDISSESESELETDDEEKVSRSREKHQISLHRKSVRKPRLKRPRLSDLQEDSSESVSTAFPAVPVAEVFDQIPDSSSHAGKRIELKIPTAVASTRVKRKHADKERSSSSQFTHYQNLPPLPQAPSLLVEGPQFWDQSHSQKTTLNKLTPMPQQAPPLPVPPPPPLPPTAMVPSIPQPSSSPTRDDRLTVNMTGSGPYGREQRGLHYTTEIDDTSDDANATRGFGIMKPPPKASREKGEQEDAAQKQWGKSKFATSSELRKGRLTESEMRQMNVYKRYEPGETSCRLYIKNVAKQTSEEDLHWLYGRYVDWDSETEQNIFDIRLMKEGRMKGQAFVTLPSDKVATDALRDTNGFLLMDKPLVVQFARSAKAQEEASSGASKSR